MDAFIFQTAVEGFAVVLGIEFGVGDGAYIGEPGDVVFFEKGKELVDRAGAVADGAEPVFKNRMRISEKSAEKLVNSYFKDYFK